MVTGCLHAFVLMINNNSLQTGFAKVGIYIGQFAVAVQVTVVIYRMDIHWQAKRLQLRVGLLGSKTLILFQICFC